MGILYPFFRAPGYMNLVKKQIPRTGLCGFMPISIRFVWRQLEFAFFGALASVAHTFYIQEEKTMKRILALHLVLIMLMSLTACGSGDTQTQPDNNPSNQQQEQSSENTTDENGRSKATEFTFELAAEEERIVENLIFDEDVTVSGDFGIIVFENCEFNGNIISTAEQFTRIILSGTTVNGNCVFKNTIKEASMDYPMPKFISSNALNIVCEDCIGSYILDGTEENITFNGETYSIDDVEFFYDANTNELVPYEEQEVSTIFIGQWWENGEKVLQLFCE